MSVHRKFFATSTKAHLGVGSIAPATKAQETRSDDTAKIPASLANNRDQVIAEAISHVGAGRYGRSLAVIDLALAATHNDPELLFARASTLFEWGRVREALDGYLRAEAEGLSDAKLHRQLGWSYFCTGCPDDAETRMRKAVAIEPN